MSGPGAPGGMRGGLTRFGLPFPPKLPNPNDVVEIPNPHLERFIPEWIRNGLITGSALPSIVLRGMQENDDPNEESQGLNDRPSPKTPFEQPPNRRPDPLGAITSFLAEQAQKRQSPPSEKKQAPPEKVDPNFRTLSRLPSPTYEWADAFKRPSEGATAESKSVGQGGRPDAVLGANGSGAQASRKPGRIESPPLVPGDAPPDPEPNVDVANGNKEGCDKEWAEARKSCAEGFSKPGEGPFSMRSDRPWTFEDCVKSLVSERCGGTPLKKGLSGAERAKRNNEMIRKKREGRGRS